MKSERHENPIDVSPNIEQPMSNFNKKLNFYVKKNTSNPLDKVAQENLFGLQQALEDIGDDSDMYTEHKEDNSNSQVHIGDLSSFLSINVARDNH